MRDPHQLFDDAKMGDRSAYDELVESFRPRLTTFCKMRLGNKLRQHVDVEDILQESSLKGFQSLDRVQWQGEKALYGWFCGIALNVIYAHANRYMHLKHASQDHQPPDDLGTSPSQHVRREERFQRLEASLAKLTDEQQQVVRLTRIEGRSVREAAAEMGRSQKATYQLLWRALKKLRDVFGETDSLNLPGDRNLGDGEP